MESLYSREIIVINSIFNLVGIFFLTGLVVYSKVKKDFNGIVAYGILLLAYILIIKNVI